MPTIPTYLEIFIYTILEENGPCYADILRFHTTQKLQNLFFHLMKIPCFWSTTTRYVGSTLGSESSAFQRESMDHNPLVSDMVCLFMLEMAIFSSSVALPSVIWSLYLFGSFILIFPTHHEGLEVLALPQVDSMSNGSTFPSSFTY